jgi:hypothetical protein
MRFIRLLPVLLLGIFACDYLAVNEFEPTGTTYNLNSNIDVVSITGSPETDPRGPMTMKMTLSSTSGSAVSAVLPAGLTFRRRDALRQHMILLKPQSVTAPASGSAANLLGAFCCNQHRLQPDIDAAYDIGPITDDAGLQQIINVVQDKDISDGTDMWMVQRAVWLVTDSTGLTQAYIDSLNALPPAR